MARLVVENLLVAHIPVVDRKCGTSNGIGALVVRQDVQLDAPGMPAWAPGCARGSAVVAIAVVLVELFAAVHLRQSRLRPGTNPTSSAGL